MAAEAASTMTGGLVLAEPVRKWIEGRERADGTRADAKLSSLCLWEPGKAWGVRLAFWPDVADAAVELNRRVVAARLKQQRRAQEYSTWAEAVEAGGDPKEVGARMGLAPARVRSFLDQLDE